MAQNRKFPHPLSRMASAYREFRRKLPAEVSNIAKNEFIDNFGRNKVGGTRDKGKFEPWKKRKIETTRSGKVTKKSGRSVLVKSGRLRRSFKIRPDINNARVVNTAPYAAIHNEGGTIKGTFKVKEHTRKGKFKVKEHTRKVSITMPKRPFMVSNSYIFNAIDQHFETQLKTIFNNDNR